jgi:hypothetical protein
VKQRELTKLAETICPSVLMIRRARSFPLNPG